MAKERLITDARSTAVPTAPASGRVRSLLTFIFRLLLLGVSVSGAWLVGVTVAHYYPARSQAMPLQEIVLRRSLRFIQRIQRIPDLWRQSSLSPQTVRPRFLPAESAPSHSQIVANPHTSSLTATEQRQIEQSLATLETELQGLSYRTADLETQLGQLPSNSPLESRLQALNQQLSSQNASTPAGNSANPATEPSLHSSSSASDTALSPNRPDATKAAPIGAVAAEVASLPQGNVLKVTLPSDHLFESEQGRLTAEATSILDSIIPDLAKYPGAAVLISGHTDNQSAVSLSREVSFQQAIAIQQRLAQTLGHTYHLVPVGYGQAQPIASNNTAADRQRNRRIEITLVPR